MKIGDVVRLKSGGPAMTVNVHPGGDYCGCVWFEGGEVMAADFNERALTPADPVDDDRLAAIERRLTAVETTERAEVAELRDAVSRLIRPR